MASAKKDDSQEAKTGLIEQITADVRELAVAGKHTEEAALSTVLARLHSLKTAMVGVEHEALGEIKSLLG